LLLLLTLLQQVESELSDVCLDVLNLLEETLVKNNTKGACGSACFQIEG
jgi:hypothetical protein